MKEPSPTYLKPTNYMTDISSRKAKIIKACGDHEVVNVTTLSTPRKEIIMNPNTQTQTKLPSYNLIVNEAPESQKHQQMKHHKPRAKGTSNGNDEVERQGLKRNGPLPKQKKITAHQKKVNIVKSINKDLVVNTQKIVKRKANPNSDRHSQESQTSESSSDISSSDEAELEQQVKIREQGERAANNIKGQTKKKAGLKRVKQQLKAESRDSRRGTRGSKGKKTSSQAKKQPSIKKQLKESRNKKEQKPLVSKQDALKEQTLLEKMRQHSRISRKKQIKSNFYLQKSDYLKWGVPIGTKGMREQYEQIVKREKERERERKKRDRQLIREMKAGGAGSGLIRKEEVKAEEDKQVKVQNIKREQGENEEQVKLEEEFDYPQEYTLTESFVDPDSRIVCLILQKLSFLYDITEPVSLEDIHSGISNSPEVKLQEPEQTQQRVENQQKRQNGEDERADTLFNIPDSLKQYIRPNRSSESQPSIFRNYKRLAYLLVTSNSMEAKHVQNQLMRLRPSARGPARRQEKRLEVNEIIKSIGHFVQLVNLQTKQKEAEAMTADMPEGELVSLREGISKSE